MRATFLVALAAACLAACGPRTHFEPPAASDQAGWEQLPVAVDRSEGSFLSTTALWAGDRLVVIHGADGQSDNIVGEVYDLHHGVVRARTSPLPWGVYATVWTGREVIVWGCCAVRRATTDSAAYDPARDSWRRLARSPSPNLGSAVWTGQEMLGLAADGQRLGLLAYDPVADRWSRRPASPLTVRSAVATAWTGRELVVWGGCNIDDHDCRRPANDGAAYDPATATWRLLHPAPIEALGGTPAVWTGSELIVWGGVSGAAYDPSGDRWRRLPPAPLSARMSHVMVWTGRDVLVWDGSTPGTAGGLAGDGARYDPISDRWTYIPAVPPGVLGPGLRDRGAGVWTPFGLVVTGGYPAADTWLLRTPSAVSA